MSKLEHEFKALQECKSLNDLYPCRTASDLLSIHELFLFVVEVQKNDAWFPIHVIVRDSELTTPPIFLLPHVAIPSKFAAGQSLASLLFELCETKLSEAPVAASSIAEKRLRSQWALLKSTVLLLDAFGVELVTSEPQTLYSGMISFTVRLNVFGQEHVVHTLLLVSHYPFTPALHFFHHQGQTQCFFLPPFTNFSHDFSQICLMLSEEQ